MWEFIAIFLITLAVYVLFFVTMLYRKTSADSTDSTGGSCGHQCHCSGGHIEIQPNTIQPMIKDKGVD